MPIHFDDEEDTDSENDDDMEREAGEELESESEEDIVRFSNTGFPLPTTQPMWSEDFVIPHGVCQLRLDFEQLDLPLLKVFQVALSGVYIAPPLTGNNTGQHCELFI